MKRWKRVSRRKQKDPINAHTLAIGTTLRQARERQSLKQDYVAYCMAISRSQLSRIEAGLSRVTIAEWDRARTALGVPKLDKIIPPGAFATAVAQPKTAHASPLEVQRALDMYRVTAEARKTNPSAENQPAAGVS